MRQFSRSVAALAGWALIGAGAFASSAAAQTALPPNDLPWLQQSPGTATAPSTTAPGTAAPGTVAPVTPVQPAPSTTPATPPATVTPAPAPGAPVSPATPGPAAGPVRGPAEVLDTANLLVAGRTIHLFGIKGEGAPYAGEMQSYLKAQGGVVDCAPRGGTADAPDYVCMTRSGYDVAEAALFNGGARVTPDAPADYRRQEQLARTARRGIWARVRRSQAVAPI